MDIIIICPHCKGSVLVNKKEFNCHIFRHGILKKNKKQINPHLSKSKCDFLFKNKLIYGCGKPFRLILKDNKYETEICGYI
jgi:hypothetical protein